jgi:RND family efflux transporter MFP subunit
MKTSHTLIVLALPLALLACGGKDKKAELAELKQQQQELNAKIRQLETELGAGKDTAAQARVTLVQVQPVAPQTLRHYLTLQGTVDSDRNIAVSPKMPGTVTAVYVKEGDAVRAGQVMAALDDAVLRQSIAELQTGLELATTVYEKQKNLWDQKIGSELQYLQAKNNKESLERKLATLNEQIAQMRVVAPISGTVDAVGLTLGEPAQPGMTTIRVVNLSAMKIVTKVADTYINTVRKGDQAEVQLGSGEKMTGRVSFVGKVVNPQTRTFDVEIALSNKDGLLKPNMLATVSINDQTKENALVVNQNLIQRTESGDIVYVAADNVARQRKIKTGLAYNGQVEITEGLKAGDQLITVGYQDLVDGQPIKISDALAAR